MMRLFPKLVAVRGGLWSMATGLRRSSAHAQPLTRGHWFRRLFGAAARRGPLGVQFPQPEGRVDLLAHALQTASDCITITDTSDRILYVNEAFLRTYEYEEHELIGQHISMVRSPDNRPEVLDGILEGTKQGVWRGVVRNRSKSGREFPISLATSLVRDEQGRVLAAVGVARDRTNEEAAESALRASEEKYRQLVENANDIIFTVDREGYCLSMNRAGQDLSGFAAETPRGVHLAQIVVPEHAEMALDRLRQVLEGERIPRFELDIKSRLGTRVTLELDVHPIRVDAAIVGAQGIARDVTARNELEAQLRQAQKMEALGHLASGVAHDFNNIVTVLIGFADLALHQLDEGNPVRADLEEIHRAAGSAASLTQQLLIFSRKSVARPRVLDLNELASGLDKMLRRLVGEDVEFIVRPGPDVGFVRADPGLIEQVIMNLVVNARDAMPTGGTLTVQTGTATLDSHLACAHQIPNPGEFATLAVTDTGIGMTPDVQAQIFQPFFTTKGPTGGTGLGLATVQRIAQQAGGGIAVESAPGHGTTFTVYLPRIESGVETARSEESAAPVDRVSGTILFVEDDQHVRTVAARALREGGYSVLTARHSEEALAIADECGEFVDLLVTDIVMPGIINGRALARLIRRSRPGLKVLFTSGYLDDTPGLQDLQAEDAGFLPKPYTLESLASEVAQALSRAPERP